MKIEIFRYLTCSYEEEFRTKRNDIRKHSENSVSVHEFQNNKALINVVYCLLVIFTLIQTKCK